MKLKNDGFTLIELLVGMLIMVILVSVAFQMLNMAYKTYQYNMAVTHNKMIIRNTMNQISDELRYADTVTFPVFPESQLPERRITYTIGGVTGTIEFDDRTKTIIINRITRTVLANGMTENTSFARDGALANAIIVTITINDGSYRNSPSTTIETVVYVSNL